MAKLKVLDLGIVVDDKSIQDKFTTIRGVAVMT